eukprot:6492143-Alexandrium_andersonii.AAC.1
MSCAQRFRVGAAAQSRRCRFGRLSASHRLLRLRLARAQSRVAHSPRSCGRSTYGEGLGGRVEAR